MNRIYVYIAAIALIIMSLLLLKAESYNNELYETLISTRAFLIDSESALTTSRAIREGQLLQIRQLHELLKESKEKIIRTDQEYTGLLEYYQRCTAQPIGFKTVTKGRE